MQIRCCPALWQHVDVFLPGALANSASAPDRKIFSLSECWTVVQLLLAIITMLLAVFNLVRVLHWPG